MSAADIAAASKVLGSIKTWYDVARAPRIALRKMQPQVTSAWLAADATGKRIEAAPAPAPADGAEPAADDAPAAPPAATSAALPAARFVFIDIRITNADTTPHSYASWNSLAGSSAILADAAGQPLEFIPPAATPGVVRLNLVEVPAGQSVHDILVFAAPQGPPGKLKLALACTALLGNVGNVKVAGPTHLGLEIPPAYLVRSSETAAAPAEIRPSPAAPAEGGDVPPPLANPPAPAKPGDPPPLTTKDLEKDAEMRKKEGGFNEVGEAKTVPNLPRKP